MRKAVMTLLVLFAALNALGHAGEVHKYMGAVTTVHDDGSFMLRKTDGETMHVAVSNSTAYVHADGKRASRSDLTTGRRVVVTISTDGKTATLVKLGPTKSSPSK